MTSCYGMKSDPDDIVVRVIETHRPGNKVKPRVMIEDPDGNDFALFPDGARKRADLIEKHAEDNRCIRLAEDIRKIADKVENDSS